jgi:hypothetical protein
LVCSAIFVQNSKWYEGNFEPPDRDDEMVLCCVGSGLVVPDVPLEETEILRSEAAKHGIELV